MSAIKNPEIKSIIATLKEFDADVYGFVEDSTEQAIINGDLFLAKDRCLILRTKIKNRCVNFSLGELTEIKGVDDFICALAKEMAENTAAHNAKGED